MQTTLSFAPKPAAASKQDALQSKENVAGSAVIPADVASKQAPSTEQLQARIKQLEQENQQLKQQVTSLKRKSTADAIEPNKASKTGEAGPSSSALTGKQQIKLLKKWAGAVPRKSKAVHFHRYCGLTDVIVEDTLVPDSFRTMFAAAGKLIQPTKDNKPTSAVTIRTMDSFEEIKQFVGAKNVIETVECNVWSQGGAGGGSLGFFGRGFGGGHGGFQKSKKLYSSTANIKTLEIQYNKTSMKLQLKFGCGLDGYEDEDY